MESILTALGKSKSCFLSPQLYSVFYLVSLSCVHALTVSLSACYLRIRADVEQHLEDYCEQICWNKKMCSFFPREKSVLWFCPNIRPDTVAHVKAATPSIDWMVAKNDDLDHDDEASILQSKGHTIITLNSQVLRIKLLQQSYKLKGTKIWLAKELTHELNWKIRKRNYLRSRLLGRIDNGQYTVRA